MTSLEMRLAAAKEKMAALEAKCGQASDKAESATPGGLTGYDPALLSGIRRKPDHKKDARRHASYDREAAAYRELAECQREVQALEARIAYAERTKPVPFTPEELAAAKAVRTSTGWHRVVRVNAKSVTVETGYSWTDRHPTNQILEVKS